MKKYIGYITRDDVNAVLAGRTVLPAKFKVVHADCEDHLPTVLLAGLAIR